MLSRRSCNNVRISHAEHYALTLHHWVRRLEAHAEEARHSADDTAYRI